MEKEQKLLNSKDYICIYIYIYIFEKESWQEEKKEERRTWKIWRERERESM